MLGGDDKFLAGPNLQLIEQTGSDHCVARIGRANHAVCRQRLEERIDLAFPIRINTDQQHSPAFTT